MTAKRPRVFLAAGATRCGLLLFFFAACCLCVAVSKNVGVQQQQLRQKFLRFSKRSVNNNNNDGANNGSAGNNVGIGSCENVRQFFVVKNISVATANWDSSAGAVNKGTICGGKCCSAEMETALRMQGQRDFADLLRHNSRSIQGLLNSTATLLQNHVMELTSQSENKTLLILSQVFRGMSALSRQPTALFYGDIRRYIQINSSATSVTTPSDVVDMKASVTRFFKDLFPLIYHHVTKLQNKDFTAEYKTCLKQTMEEVQPFGDIPRQLTQSLSKSLEATRLLLQAFDIGIEVLNTTDTLLTKESGKSNVECHQALTKMTYCPKCLGLPGNAKPCSGYCLNVLRGCLTKYVAELDSPWNSYVEAVERLVIAVKQLNNEVGVNADSVIRHLDTRISEAIMYTMEKEPVIDVKVKRACGSAKLSMTDDPSLNEAATTNNVGKRFASNMRTSFSPLTTLFQQFLVSIGKSKGFYGNLADSLCRDDSFANQKDQNCWNGERIGEYSKTVVDAGLNMQKYNPEVQPSSTLQTLDPQVATLADKLRHVHQMVISSLGTTSNLPEPDNYMQSDSADGSGSGGGPDFSDDSDDIDNRSGSGSGHGPIVVPNKPNKGPTATYGGQDTTNTNKKYPVTDDGHTTKYETPETPKTTSDSSADAASQPRTLLMLAVAITSAIYARYSMLLA